MKTLRDLIALARSKPGELNCGSAGAGNTTHLAGELLRAMAGVNIVHVPYTGSVPALIELVGGQMQFMSSHLTAALPHIKSAKLRALAGIGANAPLSPRSCPPWLSPG
jgi:tripartite-type tricarboxylate transporter receptor subunit TctC